MNTTAGYITRHGMVVCRHCAVEVKPEAIRTAVLTTDYEAPHLSCYGCGAELAEVQK